MTYRTTIPSVPVFLSLLLSFFAGGVLLAQPPVEEEVTITPLTINTGADEFGPHYVVRGNLLMFTSTRNSPTGGKGISGSGSPNGRGSVHGGNRSRPTKRSVMASMWDRQR